MQDEEQSNRVMSFLLGCVMFGAVGAAVYYAYSMGMEYAQKDLKAADYWQAIICIALVVEVTLMTVYSEMRRLSRAVYPLIFLGLAAIATSLYLEGGKVSTVLTDAKASRQYDAKAAEGGQEVVKGMMTTLKQIADRKNLTPEDLKKYLDKIDVQKEWVKGTSVSEGHPFAALLERRLSIPQDITQDFQTLLIIVFGLLVRLYLFHCGWTFWTEAFRSRKTVPEAPEKHGNKHHIITEESDSSSDSLNAEKGIVYDNKKQEEKHNRNNVVTIPELSPARTLQEYVIRTLNRQFKAGEFYKRYQSSNCPEAHTQVSFGKALKEMGVQKVRRDGCWHYLPIKGTVIAKAA